jgi:hypothetical protein
VARRSLLAQGWRLVDPPLDTALIAFEPLLEPGPEDPDLRQPPSLPATCTISVRIYLGYASFTPPSTLRMLPVLLDERAAEAKWSTASATFSGRTFTFRTLRLR